MPNAFATSLALIGRLWQDTHRSLMPRCSGWHIQGRQRWWRREWSRRSLDSTISKIVGAGGRGRTDTPHGTRFWEASVSLPYV